MADARLLEAVLGGDGDGYASPHVTCGADHQTSYAGSRPKAITTVLEDNPGDALSLTAVIFPSSRHGALSRSPMTPFPGSATCAK